VSWRASVLWSAAVVIVPASVAAQSLSGAASVSVARGTYDSDGRPSANSSIWQEYTLGWGSSILDPRLLTYTTALSVRTNTAQVGSVTFPQRGRQRDLGYKVGASLFPARPFALSIQVSNDILNESGDALSAGSLRSGIAVAADEPMPSFRTRNAEFSIAWRLGVPGLPRIEIGYRKGRSQVAGGPYRAEQRDGDTHVSASQDLGHTRHTLRYQRTSHENLVAGVFNQRMADIDYEGAATLSPRARAAVRIGRRSSFSAFDRVDTRIDPAEAIYQLPSRGQVATSYINTTFGYEPTRRVSLELTAGLDHQTATDARTTARLASMTARYDVGAGFALNGIGTIGERGEGINARTVTVFTRMGHAGVSWHRRLGWIDVGTRYTAGTGLNTTPTGETAASRSAAADATVSVSTRWFTLSGAGDRAISSDRLLTYGNLDLVRWRSSVQSDLRRVILNASYEQSHVNRGPTAAASTTWQRLFTGTASVRLGRGTLVSVNAGGFRSETRLDVERTVYAGASFESQVRRGLTLHGWARAGQTAASQTRLDQRSLAALAQLEYVRRLFSVSVEFRQTSQHLWPGVSLDAIQFRGHQFVLRITRRFGVRF
jgi:hypothetical protein